MAADRRIVAKEIETTKPRIFLRVTVRYSKADRSYWNGNQMPSGYYLSVYPYEVTEDGRGERTILGSGGSALLETAARYNAKRLRQLADAARGPDNEALNRIVANVLARSGLSLPTDAIAVEELACV